MNPNLLGDKTIVALSTPQGVSAIAVIRLSGDQSVEIVNSVFSKDISTAKGYSVHFGTIRRSDKIVDEVLVTVFRSPHSFTGENSVEIACHGSTFIQQEIIQLLLDNGASMAQAGEFSQRAFFNGKFDLSQTEAIADLIHSTSAATHDVAMRQMRGGFSNELKELRSKLIEFASLVELELDFAEEDVEFADRSQLVNLVSNTLGFVQQLKHSFKLGNAIKNGVQTTIVGRPNAGKSTLLNALLNEDRAIVSDIAGTTRDTIEEVLNINGIQFRFVDTAGLRETEDEVEKIGVSKALEKVNVSAVYIYLFDGSVMSLEEVQKDLSELPDSIARVVVANKSDLMSDEIILKFNNELEDSVVFISAKNNDSIELLQEKLLEVIDANQLNNNQTIITNARHFEALSRAEEDLIKVEQGLQMGVSGDFVAMDIRQALYHLGSITGEVSTDDLLGNIFANFCIGK